MIPAREAHHRCDRRQDPIHTVRRRFAYRISLLCSAAKALKGLLDIDWHGAPVAVQAQRLKAKVVLEKCWPLVVDPDGSAWE